MDSYPAFTVRSDPAFRVARLYRVLVSRHAVYFIRMGGFLGPADAEPGIDLHPGRLVVGALIRRIARRSLEAGVARVETRDPEEWVQSSPRHFKLTADEVVSSRLEPPSMQSVHGRYYASWTVVTCGGKQRYQVEDAESLAVALRVLPGLLNAKLTVTVDPPYGGERARSRLLG